MPLYEYQCKKCKHKFEKIQKFSDPPVRKCPDCGCPVEKVMHAPNVQFKGTGWYVTDYGGKSDKSKADGGPEKGGADKDSSDKTSSEKKESTTKDDGGKTKEKDSGAKKSEPKKSESKKSSKE